VGGDHHHHYHHHHYHYQDDVTILCLNFLLLTVLRTCVQRALVEAFAHKDEWWNTLNRLCWAIGSISGAQNEEAEKKFLVAVIQDLLSMCGTTQGKDNKAVIATNIMYIVGQYPRFLKAYWRVCLRLLWFGSMIDSDDDC
jgi:hypothetical protein